MQPRFFSKILLALVIARFHGDYFQVQASRQLQEIENDQILEEEPYSWNGILDSVRHGREDFRQSLEDTVQLVDKQVDEHVHPYMTNFTSSFYDHSLEYLHTIQEYEHELEEKYVAPIAEPIVGKKLSQFFSFSIIAFLIITPAITAWYFILYRMMEVFTVDRLLLLLNSYSALFFAALAVMTVCFTEPFVHLQSNFQDGYVGFQLFLAMMYTMNALVHIYAALSSGWMWANNLYSEEQATLIPLSVFMRVTFLVISGKFYAQAVWYPAMMDKPPLVVTSHLYILLFGMYFVMLLLPDVEESGTKKRVYETEDGPDEVRNTEE